MKVNYDEFNLLDICACLLAVIAIIVAFLALIYTVFINDNTNNTSNNTRNIDITTRETNEHVFAIRKILEKYDTILSNKILDEF